MDQSITRPRYSVPRSRPDMRFLWRFNDCRIDGNAAYLLLRDKDNAPCGEGIIDLWDLERVREASCWGLHRPKPDLLYVRGMMRGLGAPRGKRKPAIYLHRFIVDAPKGKEVDHWDGNGLNCRRDNLRVTDRQGNALNLYGHRRVRELESVMRDLLRCSHKGQTCQCKRRALEMLGLAA